MATLTIWRFGSWDGAAIAAERLESLAREQLVTVHDAAMVSWPANSTKPKLRQLHSLAGRGALSGAFWGMLFGLIFFVPLLGAALGAAAGAASGALADVGIDDGVIKDVRDRLTPGTSAIFLLTSGAVVERVREVFPEAENPELLFTNLSPEQERELRSLFEPVSPGQTETE